MGQNGRKGNRVPPNPAAFSGATEQEVPKLTEEGDREATSFLVQVVI